jgi:hypothetical protein
MNIFKDDPLDWYDLQEKVAKVFEDINYYVKIEKDLETVRGNVNVDVYIEDNTNFSNVKYICKCKYWNTNVPQTIVHTFRTVVNDYGANVGYLITKNGFQTGAYKAVQNSNVYLLTWKEFITLFEKRWLISMINKTNNIGKLLRDYTDFLDLEFYNKAKDLGIEKLKQFEFLVKNYRIVAMYTAKMLYTDINNEVCIPYIEKIIERLKNEKRHWNILIVIVNFLTT